MFDARQLTDRLVGGSESLFGSREGRRWAAAAAGLGGLALVAGLAYRAFQARLGGVPLVEGAQAAVGKLTGSASDPASALPTPASFDPANVSEDEALLYARAMVAAVTADGQVAARERERLTGALAKLNIGTDAARWLQDEIENPASVEALAEPVNTPEAAAKVYAAARLAIDPDTMQELEFLRQLAESLDLEPALRRHIDDAASGMRTAG